METFLLERSIPPRFDPSDADQVALHARWALDAYREVGAVWLGGVVTEDRMFSLVTAEQAADEGPKPIERKQERRCLSGADSLLLEIVDGDGSQTDLNAYVEEDAQGAEHGMFIAPDAAA